jgi:cell cycle sensor histidine kinase DivJ
MFARVPLSSPEDARRVRRWHGLWALLALASGALLTLILGEIPAATYAAFAALAVAGGLGMLIGGAGRTLMVFWALLVAFALSATGGMTGPGAPWVLTLFAAALVLRRSMLEAALLAALAAAIAAAAELSSVRASPPTEWLRGLLTVTGLATSAWALATAAVLGRTLRRSETEPTGLEADPQPEPESKADTQAEPGLEPTTEAVLAEPDPTPELRERLAAAEAAREAALAEAAAAEAARAAAEAGREEAHAANAAKSRFLANMSHELRTPLNAVMGFADIMRNRLFGPLPDRYAEYAQLIHESGAHLLDLINDVLDMSKIEAERFRLSREVFDAREAVTAVLRLMRPQADEAGVLLRGVLPDEPLTVDADKRALKQIALNLISNALKFTPRDGAVTVNVSAAAGALELTVSDTGVGIAPEDLARLGRPYEQAGDADSRAQGTGLGLSLVRAFAGLHGGEMNLESALGEGTAVTVRLPVLVEEPPVQPAVTGEVIPFTSR